MGDLGGLLHHHEQRVSMETAAQSCGRKTRIRQLDGKGISSSFLCCHCSLFLVDLVDVIMYVGCSVRPIHKCDQ